MNNLSFRCLTLAAALSLGVGQQARAVEFVQGGFADAQVGYKPEPLRLNAPSTRLGVQEISFTPRHGGLFVAGPSTQLVEKPISFRMDFEAGYGLGLDFNPPSALYNRHAPTKNLLVGGAIEIEELNLLGGVGQTSLFGERADLFMAGMSLGGLEARVGVGETAQEVQGARDVMMLSTDLRLSPWISVQGDLAVGERSDEQESLAVGRVGVRLRF